MITAEKFKFTLPPNEPFYSTIKDSSMWYKLMPPICLIIMSSQPPQTPIMQAPECFMRPATNRPHFHPTARCTSLGARWAPSAPGPGWSACTPASLTINTGPINSASRQSTERTHWEKVPGRCEIANLKDSFGVRVLGRERKSSICEIMTLWGFDRQD